MDYNMADWFKFYNDGLDEPRFQYAISEQSAVTGVWLLILSEASKKRSCKITWRDLDFELFGYAKKLNISVPILNQCIGILERIEYIRREDGFIVIPEWDKRQSDYAKGLEKGYYKKTSKSLASASEVSTTRGEESRGEEKKEEEKRTDPLEDDFNAFWQKYPYKVGKPKARSSYKKARETYSHQQIIEPVSIWASSPDWTKENGQYIPHPSTWLNQERFNDRPKSFVNTAKPVRPKHLGRYDEHNAPKRSDWPSSSDDDFAAIQRDYQAYLKRGEEL